MRQRTCSKWVARYLAEGELGLLDRSSAPKVVANRTVSDDATRLAYAEVLPDEIAAAAIAFLYRAVAFYRRHGSPSSAC